MSARIGIIAARSANVSMGGAERFFDAMVDAFRANGHDAEEVTIPGDEPTFEQIQRNYLAAYDLDLSRFDVVVSSKAPTWMVRHPRHVCWLMHTIRVFYDMFEETFPEPSPELLAQRDLVHTLDTGALAYPRCRRVFSIGEEVSSRLRKYNGMDAEVLHPPLWTDAMQPGATGDYFFVPGRLHPWKRVDLAIRAMRQVKAPVRMLISGVGQAEADLRALAAGDPRIEFLGRLDDDALAEHYANALGVLFVPKREDYGYITLEAFASGKPVITCRDSGEAAAIVAAQGGGLVAEPDAASVAACMERIAGAEDRGAAMGMRGRVWVGSLSWKRIAQRLYDAAMEVPGA